MINTSQNISSERSDRNIQRFLWKLILPFYSRRFFFVALILHFILLLIFANTIFFQRWLDLQQQEEHGNFICAKPSEKPPGGNSPPPASVQLKEVIQPISAISVKTLSVNTLKEINVSIPTMVQNNSSVSDNIAESFLESGTGTGIGKGIGTGIGDGIGVGVGSGGGSIFGTKISGPNIFIVMDISSSMGAGIAPLFEEVRRDFPNATYKYVFGCNFVTTDRDPCKKYRENGLKNMLDWYVYKSGISKAKEVKEADVYVRMNDCVLDILKNNSKVDAIYFFADFHDYVDSPKISNVLEQMLSAARQKPKVPQFVFHSVDKENELLAKIASETKGSFFVKKITKQAKDKK
jgi:hypothetical protein